MTIPEFIAKWRKVDLKERSAAQEHFIDLCNVFHHPATAAADPAGKSFYCERGTAKHGDGDGFTDVWKRAFSCWECKGKHKDLDDAYDQMLRYRDALESSPLLVVCDLCRIVVHTNFTGTVSATYDIPMEIWVNPETLKACGPFSTIPRRFENGHEGMGRIKGDRLGGCALEELEEPAS